MQATKASPIWSLLNTPAPDPCIGTTGTMGTTGTPSTDAGGNQRRDAEVPVPIVPVVPIVPDTGEGAGKLDDAGFQSSETNVPIGFEIIEVDPDEVPNCSCGRTMASQGLDGVWRCSHCNADEVAERRRTTQRWMREVHRIRSQLSVQ